MARVPSSLLTLSLVVLAGCGGAGSGASGGTTGAAGAGTGAAGTTGIAGAGTGRGGTPAPAGTAGTSGMAGTASTGEGGASGAAGSSGASFGGAHATGGEPAGPCAAFNVDHWPSPAISTVEIVTFSLGLQNLNEAHIDFGPSGAAPTMTAPVELDEPAHRTLLLGMKAGRPYTFRVVARAGAITCTSADVSLTTGALPSGAPTITRTASGTGGAKGFIVTTTGLDIQQLSVGQPNAYVFDTDGDIVWWSSSMLQDNQGISRAHMSWDGRQMWVMTIATGQVVSVSMDGTTTTAHAELSRADHDLTVLPDGGIATVLRPQPGGKAYSFVERKSDGTIVTVVADLKTLYNPSNFHPNAVHYYPADESYTLSDLNGSLFVKFKRTGQLLWQLGGANPVGKSLTLVGLTAWSKNHGHHLTPDGHFLFFNNGAGTFNETMIDLLLDEANGTATKTWDYHSGDGGSPYLGDVERLPNGNVLVTYSNSGVIYEVAPSGDVVQWWKGTSFGYADFRTSLYGPPPR